MYSGDRGHCVAAAVKQIAFERELKAKAERRKILEKPKKSETRRSPISLYVSLDLREKIKANALCEGTSMNDYINNILEDAMGGESNEI